MNSHRVHSLDVLRGVAVLLVLIRHLPSNDASSPLRFIQSIGWSGVDLFFVLSGFLISGLLFSEFDKTGRLDVKRFWLRRGLKIWPSYYLTYGTAMILTIIATGDTNLLISRIPNYIFIQNYMDFDVRWTHSWSIAIEEHFYFLLPLVLLILIPTRLRTLPKICLLVCAYALLLRVSIFLIRDLPWANFYYPSHMRFDSLCFGVLLGYFNQYKRDLLIGIGQRFWPVFLLAPCALVLANLFPVEQSAFSYTVGFTVFYLMFGGLVVTARAFPGFGSSGPQKFIAIVGVYSYTIYLAHSVIYELPGMTAARESVITQFGYLGDRVMFFTLSMVLGVLISHAVERPFLRLRARWFPAVSRPVYANPRPATDNLEQIGEEFAGTVETKT